MLTNLVGNIPYNVTVDQMKDIFSEAGPVVSFRYLNASIFAVNCKLNCVKLQNRPGS